MGSSSNTSSVGGGGGGGGGGRLASPEEVREEEARDGEVVHLERDARELTRHIATTHRLYRKARSHLPPIMRYHSDTGRLHRNCFGMALGPRACVAADPSVRATLWRQSQLLRSLALTYFTKWETLVAAHTRARTATRDLGLALHLTMKAQQDRWLPPPPPDARGERGERGEMGDVPYATDATGPACVLGGGASPTRKLNRSAAASTASTKRSSPHRRRGGGNGGSLPPMSPLLRPSPSSSTAPASSLSSVSVFAALAHAADTASGGAGNQPRLTF